MFLLNLLPAPLHRALYRLAHGVRVQVWKVWRPRVHGVRVLALDAQGRVLLVRHSYGSDNWMTPGGGMQRAEDPLAAAARELLEETGCRIDCPHLLTRSDEVYHGTANTVRVIIGRTGDQPTVDGREIVEARFFAIDDLPPDMSQFLKTAIPQWIGQGSSEI